MNRSIYGPSQPRHTLVLERIPATSAPTVQTAKRCHVWLFGQLEPLVKTLSSHCLSGPGDEPSAVQELHWAVSRPLPAPTAFHLSATSARTPQHHSLLLQLPVLLWTAPLLSLFFVHVPLPASSGALHATTMTSTVCPPAASFFGFMGAASALIFSNLGAAYGTAKSGVGVASMGVMRPELVMRCIIPVVMAGVLGYVWGS